jgi:hypothetical protein
MRVCTSTTVMTAHNRYSRALVSRRAVDCHTAGIFHAIQAKHAGFDE